MKAETREWMNKLIHGQVMLTHHNQLVVAIEARSNGLVVKKLGYFHKNKYFLIYN